MSEDGKGEFKIDSVEILRVTGRVHAGLVHARRVKNQAVVTALELGLISLFCHLLAKTRNQGMARVIISLSAPLVPEGGLANEAMVHRQRDAIADAQSAVLARLLGCAVESVRRYQYMPAMAMEVFACSLERLMKAQEVSYIIEDVLLSST
jgi:hypothetical protein